MSELEAFDAVPRTWAEFEWPGWIPVKLREQIQEFWREDWGRGPRAWLRDVETQEAPWTGEHVTLEVLCGRARGERETVTGRYVHAWNNIGRVVRADGSWETVSFGSGGLFFRTGYVRNTEVRS